MLESTRWNSAKRTIEVKTVHLLKEELALAERRCFQDGQAVSKDREMWTAIMPKKGAAGWRIAVLWNMPLAASR